MMEFEAGPSGKGWHTHWEGEQLVLVINRPEQARLSLMPHGPKVQLVVQLPPELTAILAAHESGDVSPQLTTRAWASAVVDGWTTRRTLRRVVPYVLYVCLVALTALGCLALLGRLTHIHVLAAMALGATSLLVSMVADLAGRRG